MKPSPLSFFYLKNYIIRIKHRYKSRRGKFAAHVIKHYSFEQERLRKNNNAGKSHSIRLFLTCVLKSTRTMWHWPKSGGYRSRVAEAVPPYLALKLGGTVWVEVPELPKFSTNRREACNSLFSEVPAANCDYN
jgi:hypothetical protein